MKIFAHKRAVLTLVKIVLLAVIVALIIPAGKLSFRSPGPRTFALGCVETSSSSLMSSLVSTARASFFEPLPDPRTRIRDPFYYGVIMHGCTPPGVDLRCNGTNGPCTIPSDTAATLSWTTLSAHGAISCTTGGPWQSPGPRPPAGSESTGILFTGTYTYFLFCFDQDGAASDSVTVIVAPGSPPTVDIKANGSDGPIAVPSLSIVTLSWTTTNSPTSCSASGSWSGSKNPAGGSELTPPLLGPAAYTYAITCTNPNGSGSDIVTVNVLRPPAIFGDIYAAGQIANLKVQGPAVVSAGVGIPQIQQFGTVYIVSNYAPSLRGAWRAIMDGNISRLRSERAIFTASLPSDFDGTPDRLGGGVWYRPSGLSVPAANITGRGTFIVDNGTIELTGNLISASPVGFVARNGNIVIRSGVGQIRNVSFYAPNGTITFDNAATTLDATGSFIANRFSFSARELEIAYDAKVALTPPPGFISFILPTILERAP